MWRQILAVLLIGWTSMAFPVIEAVGETNGSTAATNKVCNLPTGIVSGDLLILELRSNGADTHSTPTGWTSIVLNDASDASDDTQSIWRRIADGAEGASVTVNGTASLKFSSVSLRISGHDSATAPTVSAVATGTTASPNSATLTPAGGAKDFLWLSLGGWEGEQTDPPTFPTSYTLGQVAASSGVGGAIATNSRSACAGRQLNAATEDPGAYTISVSDDWNMRTLAVYPAAAGNTISPSSIASAEAFGTAKEILTLPTVGGLASAEVFGSAREVLTLLAAGAIASGEAFGTAREVLILLPSGLASGEAIGAHTVQTGAVIISPTGIVSEEAFGTHKQLFRVTLVGITSAEAFGVAKQLLALLGVGGIPSGETFGSHRQTFLVSGLTGILSGEVFGLGGLVFIIRPAGLASGEVFGPVTVQGGEPAALGTVKCFFRRRR